MKKENQELKEAVFQGNIEQVKMLLKKNLNINLYDDFLLREAVKQNNIEMTQLLLDNGADIHAKNGEPLISACTNGNLEMVVLLLENKANLHKQDNEAFYQACHHHHNHIVNYLIKEKASFNGKRADTFLNTAIINKNIQLVELLLTNQKKRKQVEIDKLLVDAVITGEVEIVKLIIKEGAQIEERGYQALKEGVRECYVDIVAYLCSLSVIPIEEINDCLKSLVKKKLPIFEEQLQTIHFLVEQGANDKIVLEKGTSSIKEYYINYQKSKELKLNLENNLPCQNKTNKPKL